MKKSIFMGALVLATGSAFSTTQENLLNKVRHGEPGAVKQAYRLYRISRNVSDRQELRETLQTTLDIDPRLILEIKGINAETFCDGSDIASISNESLVIKSVELRLAKINSSAIPIAVKQRCIKSLSRLKSCTISQNC